MLFHLLALALQDRVGLGQVLAVGAPPSQQEGTESRRNPRFLVEAQVEPEAQHLSIASRTLGFA